MTEGIVVDGPSTQSGRAHHAHRPRRAGQGRTVGRKFYTPTGRPTSNWANKHCEAYRHLEGDIFDNWLIAISPSERTVYHSDGG